MEKSSIRRMLNITDIMMKYLRARKSSVPFEDVIKSVSEGLTIWLNVTSEENKISLVSQKTFQSFFIVLYELINHCRNSPVDDEFEFAKMASYRGFAYRYICAAHNDDLAPDVAYNNTFVSWNRAPYSTSLESSFTVRVTWVKCEIVAPTFGINLEGISRWLKQHEMPSFRFLRKGVGTIVYPTKKKAIVKIVKDFAYSNPSRRIKHESVKICCIDDE